MPRKVVDYSKTVIYKIVCKDLNITELYTVCGSYYGFYKKEM